MNDSAWHQQTSHGRERRDRIGEVLDRVVQRDRIEARRRKIEILEAARGHTKTAVARALRGERGDLDALDVPTRGLRLEEEVAERATDVEETAATTVAPLDRLDAVAEGAPVHVGVEEVVGVAALGVVGRVVVGVVDRGRGERSRVLADEPAARAFDDERAVDLEERARDSVGAERARVGDLGRARRSANERVGDADPEVRKRAHDGTVASAAASFDPCSGEASSGSPLMRSRTTLYAKPQKAMRKATVAMTLP